MRAGKMPKNFRNAHIFKITEVPLENLKEMDTKVPDQ